MHVYSTFFRSVPKVLRSPTVKVNDLFIKTSPRRYIADFPIKTWIGSGVLWLRRHVPSLHPVWGLSVNWLRMFMQNIAWGRTWRWLWSWVGRACVSRCFPLVPLETRSSVVVLFRPSCRFQSNKCRLNVRTNAWWTCKNTCVSLWCIYSRSIPGNTRLPTSKNATAARHSNIPGNSWFNQNNIRASSNNH